MTDSDRPRYESPADRAIREAMERGEFDDLPGAGKPLTNLGDPDDALWWVRRLAEREHLDFSAALPPAIALRKEAAAFPRSLQDLRTEAAVREVLEDFNRRVRRDRLRPPDPGMPQLIAPTVDVEAIVDEWRVLREQRAAVRPGAARDPADHAPGRPGRAGRATHTSKWWLRWWPRAR
ncbi:DUF1992 domain-containing protein [Nostocoides sp. F2B08]|uniref:DnaJ family domain-containing protein n=1 Tax=Nostocoides sp. F2B08 TaxID=2653936 RepID=UPI001262AF33|nr:DUF1992 domain-containing protein [Tetrasphaera sp. F2B08]KAB7743564.1 DUF1992 domain-containing protein [Tetrasphaera sp. F2B08]